MWDDFKIKCLDCLELVPYKYSSTKYSQPWVTSGTKRICRKKKRLHNKAHSSGSAADWTNNKEVKKVAQHQCHNVYFIMFLNYLIPAQSGRNSGPLLKGIKKIVLGFHHYLYIGGTNLIDDIDKANTLNDQYLLGKMYQLYLTLHFLTWMTYRLMLIVLFNYYAI